MVFCTEPLSNGMYSTLNCSRTAKCSYTRSILAYERRNISISLHDALYSLSIRKCVILTSHYRNLTLDVILVMTCLFFTFPLITLVVRLLL